MVAIVTYPTQQIGEVLLLVVVGVALFFAPELYVEVGRLRLLHSQSSVCQIHAELSLQLLLLGAAPV